MDLSGSDPKIALALSGGGFRATLFHLGVIRYLRTANRLKDVRHIAAVSGGSILAAHLAANWNLYTGSFEEFLSASDQVLAFTARNIRGRILRRVPWIMIWWFMPRFVPLLQFLPRSTTDLLMRELRKFYSNINLADLPILSPSSPKLSLLATNLTHPGITAFENDRVVCRHMSGKEDVWRGTSVPLHLAVACSAAYPAFFPPVAVSDKDLLPATAYGTQYHSDGGVIDNQGLQTILSDKEAEMVIISDAASASTDSQPTLHFGILASGLRSMELMMAQIRRGHYRNISANNGRPTILINIEQEAAVNLDREDLRTPIYSQLSQIRTDLNEFDAVEREELVYYGYLSAQDKLGWAITDTSTVPPEHSKILPSAVARHIQSRSGFQLGLISWKDPVAIINLVTILVLAGLFGLKAFEANRALFELSVLQTEAENEIRERPLGLIPQAKAIPLITGEVGERPTNPGFTVTQEARLWDLRALMVSPTKGTIVGPAYMTRYIDLRRDYATADAYAFSVEAAGPVYAWTGRGDSRLAFKLIGQTPRKASTAEGRPSTLIRYKCLIDCARVPVKEPFIIVIQMRLDDAFLNRAAWTLGAIAQNKTKRISMRIVFPRNLPFENPSFRRYPTAASIESVPFDGKAYTISGQPELLWTVSQPISGSVYRVNWDWYPENSRR